MYVVDRDFGFAPNPFHGVCTLATCKPKIRGVARHGDWVVGMGGRRLKATGKCIFAMRVDRIMQFKDYWLDPQFYCKRPVRNGSRKMLIGDNIYHINEDGIWIQADSHHSLEDGSPNMINLSNDTSRDAVLLSEYFFYFGTQAPEIPQEILNQMEWVNRVGHRNYDFEKTGHLIIDWILNNHIRFLNLVMADPFDFAISSQRFSPGVVNSNSHIRIN